MLRCLLQDGPVPSAKLVMAGSPSVLKATLVRPQRSMKLATNSVANGVASLDGKLIAAAAPVSLSTTTSVVANYSSASVTPALVLMKQ